ncbi:MAG: peptide-methionine (R)-S-oxide reductase MsrB [Bacteroidia bacterium]
MKDNLTNHKLITSEDDFEIKKSELEWQKQLTPDQYRILRQKGTERPFTSKFEDFYDGGIYTCAGCGNELFTSDTKFDSGCGWPSFYDALDSSKIVTKIDYTHGMTRVEIMCAKCGGHLGHVFNDGPQDKTGLRYCVNGLSLDFKKK